MRPVSRLTPGRSWIPYDASGDWGPPYSPPADPGGDSRGPVLCRPVSRRSAGFPLWPIAPAGTPPTSESPPTLEAIEARAPVLLRPVSRGQPLSIGPVHYVPGTAAPLDALAPHLARPVTRQGLTLLPGIRPETPGIGGSLWLEPFDISYTLVDASTYATKSVQELLATSVELVLAMTEAFASGVATELAPVAVTATMASDGTVVLGLCEGDGVVVVPLIGNKH